MLNHYFAYCYNDGVIGFSRLANVLPTGAIIFAEGDGEKFKDEVKVKCRRAYNGRNYICVGLPEKDKTKFLRWHKWAFPTQKQFLSNFEGAA